MDDATYGQANLAAQYVRTSFGPLPLRLVLA